MRRNWYVHAPCSSLQESPCSAQSMHRRCGSGSHGQPQVPMMKEKFVPFQVPASGAINASSMHRLSAQSFSILYICRPERLNSLLLVIHYILQLK